MPKIIGIVLIFVISILIIGDVSRPVLLNPQDKINKPNTDDLDFRKEINYDNILIRINELRLKEGLPQLTVNLGLQNYAVARAEEMNRTSTFTHLSKLRFENYSRVFSLTGELIASNYSTTGDVINGWLKSPTHKDLILSKDFDSIGIAIVKNNSKLEDIVVVELGKPW